MKINFLSEKASYTIGYSCGRQNFKSRPKVSVVVPIYNQEKYLEKGLKSLQNQTLKDIEIICVNDGSTDNSLKILQDIAKDDKRIKIINQQNQGSGCARNNGLKQAQGEYLAFLDPDDWLELNALEELYSKADKQNCDVVVFNFNKINEKDNQITDYNIREKFLKPFNISENHNFNWKDIKPCVFGGIYLAAWNKLYRMDFVRKNNLHFSKCSLAEDNVFVIGATLSAKNIGYANKYYYNYLVHENSALRSKSDKNLCLFKSIDSVKRLVCEKGLTEELAKEFNQYIFRLVNWHKKQVVSKSKFFEVCKRKLSKDQSQTIIDRHSANQMLLPLLDLLKRKIK